MKTEKTILLELTEEEAKMVLSAVWLRFEELKDKAPKSALKYKTILREIEKQGVQI